MKNWICSVLLILLQRWITVEGAQLTITPQPITAVETSPVIMTCAENTISDVKTLYVIAVLRDVTDPTRDNKVTVASANFGENNDQAKLIDRSLSQRATVTGKLDNNNKQGSFIQVSLTSMSCQDSGSYYCEITYNSVNGNFERAIHNVNITVQSNPSNVVMIVYPRREASPYYLNETVEFRCIANVGFPPKAWSWQWKYADRMTGFTSYPYTQRIKDDPPTTSSCISTGGTTLKHIVTIDDNARIFRCLVDNNELYSDNFTIYTQCNPSNVVMIVHPRREASPYYVNETVEFRCIANVGFPPKTWSWEWKYADSMTGFTSYPYTQRIKYDPPTTSSCISTGGTTLKHIVTINDNAIIFRCLVDNNELYSDKFTIYTQCHSSNVVMAVHPRKKASPYYLNETVEFRCTANVGFPPRPWSWEWKYADSMTGFTSYPYTQIIKDDPPTTSGCGSTGRTTLNHTVTIDDNARMFRCLVDNNELYSDKFTIYTQSGHTETTGVKHTDSGRTTETTGVQQRDSAPSSKARKLVNYSNVVLTFWILLSWIPS